MRIVVSDTSPIRVLQHLGHLDLLGKLFDEVLIPPAVARECARATAHLPALDPKSIPRCREVSPHDLQAIAQLQQSLQRAEAEAITLARELSAELLIDERAGRRIAAQLGLRRVGVIGLLLRAKHRGLIPARDNLGFFVSDKLIEDARLLAGE